MSTVSADDLARAASALDEAAAVLEGEGYAAEETREAAMDAWASLPEGYPTDPRPRVVQHVRVIERVGYDEDGEEIFDDSTVGIYANRGQAEAGRARYNRARRAEEPVAEFRITIDEVRLGADLIHPRRGHG